MGSVSKRQTKNSDRLLGNRTINEYLYPSNFPRQSNMPNTRVIGNRAETHALNYLLDQGLKLLQRNYNCKCGELDLIMTENNIIVFVEVRSRKNSYYGSGAESIDFRKRKKLLASATHFLQNKRMLDEICRFDVISICHGQSSNVNSVENKSEKLTINWIQDAFQA